MKGCEHNTYIEGEAESFEELSLSPLFSPVELAT
jgi:hypothetical protein